MKALLYGIWLFLYFLCGILGIMEPETGWQSGAMTVIGVLFFVPPAILLVRGLKQGDKKILKTLRFVSILSLSLTMVGFIVNIAAVNATDRVGLILYRILNFVSVPMICSRHYVLSLFLWAVLLFATFPKLYTKTGK